MENLVFGPARGPLPLNGSSTGNGISGIASVPTRLGAGVRTGVEMSQKSARPPEQLATEKGVALSGRASYFTHFDNTEPQNIAATQERSLHAL